MRVVDGSPVEVHNMCTDSIEGEVKTKVLESTTAGRNVVADLGTSLQEGPSLLLMPDYRNRIPQPTNLGNAASSDSDWIRSSKKL